MNTEEAREVVHAVLSEAQGYVRGGDGHLHEAPPPGLRARVITLAKEMGAKTRDTAKGLEIIVRGQDAPYVAPPLRAEVRELALAMRMPGTLKVTETIRSGNLVMTYPALLKDAPVRYPEV
jgi:hypothetical protein